MAAPLNQHKLSTTRLGVELLLKVRKANTFVGGVSVALVSQLLYKGRVG